MPATVTSWKAVAAVARDYVREYVAGRDTAADRLRMEALVLAGADLSGPWSHQHDYVCHLSTMTAADAENRTKSDIADMMSTHPTAARPRVRVIRSPTN
jgi:hypothetical protein